MNTKKPISRQQLVTQLETSGNSISTEKFSTLFDLQKTPDPWYIPTMLGFAAIFSAILLTNFLYDNIPYKSATLHIIAGMIFTIIAIAGKRFLPSTPTISQLTVIFSIMGLIFFEIGLARYIFENIRSPTQMVSQLRVFEITVILFELVVFALYSSPIRRYIATINIIVAFLVIVHIKHSIMSVQIAYITLAILSLVAWEIHAQFKGRWHSIVRIVPPIMLLVLLMLTLIPHELYRFLGLRYEGWWPSTLTISLCFIALIARIVYRTSKPNIFYLLGASALVVIIALLTHHTPGILGALFVIVLGYAHGHKTLMAFAFVFLTVFLVHYYYSTNLTLFEKSISLMTVGGIFIIAAWVSQLLTRSKEKLA